MTALSVHNKKESDGFATCIPRLSPLMHQTALLSGPQPRYSPNTVTFLHHENHQGRIIIPVFSGVSPSLDSHRADLQARFGVASWIREDSLQQLQLLFAEAEKPAASCAVGPTRAMPMCLNLGHKCQALHQWPVMKMLATAMASGFINLPLMCSSINFNNC